MNKIQNTPTLLTEDLILNRYNEDDSEAMYYGWANSENKKCQKKQE